MQWDGKPGSGDWVAPAQPYIAEATMRDEFGNSSRVSSAIAVSGLPQAAPQAALPRHSRSPQAPEASRPRGTRSWIP